MGHLNVNSGKSLPCTSIRYDPLQGKICKSGQLESGRCTGELKHTPSVGLKRPQCPPQVAVLDPSPGPPNTNNWPPSVQLSAWANGALCQVEPPLGLRNAKVPPRGLDHTKRKCPQRWSLLLGLGIPLQLPTIMRGSCDSRGGRADIGNVSRSLPPSQYIKCPTHRQSFYEAAGLRGGSRWQWSPSSRLSLSSPGVPGGFTSIFTWDPSWDPGLQRRPLGRCSFSPWCSRWQRCPQR